MANSQAASPAAANAKKNDKRSNYYKSSRRREQCRINQRRYREKIKAFKLNQKQELEHLRQEIESLKKRRREISFREKSNRSPWRVVVDVFDLIEKSFRSPWCMANDKDMVSQAEVKQLLVVLEKSFEIDVAMGGLRSVDKMMGQLHSYSQFFGNPDIRLKGVKEVVPGFVTATATLGVSVSVLTLRCVFPHLLKATRSKYDTQPLLSERILGQRLECNCSMTFHFEEESARVSRLDVNIDWATPLLRALGNLEDVAKVLDGAEISSECIITENF